MAMNLRALNIGLGKGKAEAKAAPKEKPAKKGAATSATTLEGGAPRPRSGLLAGKSFKQQMQLLVAAALILTAVIFVFASFSSSSICQMTGGCTSGAPVSPLARIDPSSKRKPSTCISSTQ